MGTSGRGGAPRLAVLGSFNMDLVFRAPRLPALGETLRGTSFATFMGGKGANQALAAARAGAEVQMIGRLGADSFGETISAAMAAEGVKLDHVSRDPEAGTGVAGIIVEPNGANSIVVVPQANERTTVADVERARDAIVSAQVLLLQLEIPTELSAAAARIAKRAGRTVIWNPAPARPLPPDVLALVDVLVPNESETAQLTGIDPATDESASRAAHALLERGARAVVLTLGERGALVVDGARETRVPSISVAAVDTTAAGDAFCGALAVALAEGRTLDDAVRFGCVAGALAVTVMGAAPSLPRRDAIERALGR